MAQANDVVCMVKEFLNVTAPFAHGPLEDFLQDCHTSQQDLSVLVDAVRVLANDPMAQKRLDWVASIKRCLSECLALEQGLVSEEEDSIWFAGWLAKRRQERWIQDKVNNRESITQEEVDYLDEWVSGWDLITREEVRIFTKGRRRSHVDVGARKDWHGNYWCDNNVSEWRCYASFREMLDCRGVKYQTIDDLLCGVNRGGITIFRQNGVVEVYDGAYCWYTPEEVYDQGIASLQEEIWCAGDDTLYDDFCRVIPGHMLDDPEWLRLQRIFNGETEEVE